MPKPISHTPLLGSFLDMKLVTLPPSTFLANCLQPIQGKDESRTIK